MLTGKDMVQAVERTKIERSSMDAYEELARLLNASHIIPLQGQVETLQAQNAKLTADIKRLRDLDRKIFDDQEKQIDELKTLIKSFVALLKDEDLMIEDSSDGWYENREIALLSAQQLLKDQ